MKKLGLLVLALVFGASLVYGQTSRQNRDESLLYLDVALVGLHLPTLFTTAGGLPTVGAGIYLGEFLAIGGQFGKWEDSDTEQESTFTGDFTNAGVVIKLWPGTNSFYISLAGHQREWTVSATTALPSNGLLVSAELRAKTTVASLGIGNQWMIGAGGFIQVDWLVLSGAVSESVEFQFSSPVAPGNLAEAQREFQDLGDTLNDFSSFSGAVILTFGWGF